MTLLAVIVNYRTPDLTVDCLRTLVAQVRSLPGSRVVVVDNRSGDDSPARIGAAIESAGWSAWVTLMPLDHNGGFAYGNNAAIRPALNSTAPPKYILLLNPDTLVLEGALPALLQFMGSRPEVGIAGGRIQNADGSSRRSAFRFHSIPGEFNTTARVGLVARLLRRWVVAPDVRDAAHPTDWVSGACMMIRRDVFERIGLLDEAYFLYYEEMDFCLRAARAGFSCWYVPEARVTHLVGQASGVTGEQKRHNRVPKYWFQSRRHFWVKNHGRLRALAADVVWTLGWIIWRTKRLVIRLPDEDPPHMLGDFVRYNFLSVNNR